MKIRKHILLEDIIVSESTRPGTTQFYDRNQVEKSITKDQWVEIKEMLKDDEDIDYVSKYGYHFYRKDILNPSKPVGVNPNF